MNTAEPTHPMGGTQIGRSIVHTVELTRSRSRELRSIPPDGLPMTVDVRADQSRETYSELLATTSGRRWQLLLSVGTGRFDATGIRDLGWIASAPTPPVRIYIGDPALHSLPGLGVLPDGVEELCFDATETSLDWSALASKLGRLSRFESRALGRTPCDLRAFAEHGCPATLVLHYHDLVAADRTLGLVAMQLNSCRLRSGDMVAFARSLGSMRRFKLEGKGLDLELCDRLPQLDWLELHAIPGLERLPEVTESQSVLRVLRLGENRKLVDVSSITRMSALRELAIVDCPKLRIDVLLTAPNVKRMDLVAVASHRKKDVDALAAALPGVFRLYRDAVLEDF